MNERDQLPESLRRLRPKGDGFRPADPAYLREVAERAILTAREEETINTVGPEGNGTRLRRLTRWLPAVAAAMLLLLWFKPWAGDVVDAGPAMENPTVADDWETHLDDVSDEELLAYIQENIQEFELETLIPNEEEE